MRPIVGSYVDTSMSTSSHVNGSATDTSTLSGTSKANDGFATLTSTGDYRIQLAASRSEDSARAAWVILQGQYPDIFDGLEGQVEKADLGVEKGTWYRLRVGTALSKARAYGICQKLTERQAPTGCLPIRGN